MLRVKIERVLILHVYISLYNAKYTFYISRSIMRNIIDNLSRIFSANNKFFFSLLVSI